MNEPGVSPVVGIALMIVITLLLATILSVSLGYFGDLNDENERMGSLLDTSEPTGDYSDQSLVPVGEPGEEPRTSGGEILEFRVENTQDSPLTVVSFEINATGIDSGMTVDDGNAKEVEIRRASQTGTANRDESPDEFAGDGTQYDLVGDSTTGGQKAEIGRDDDDVEIDIRRFSDAIGTLEITDSADDADLIVKLISNDGSEHGFYFEQP